MYRVDDSQKIESQCRELKSIFFRTRLVHILSALSSGSDGAVS
jgi:hypothetical protein